MTRLLFVCLGNICRSPTAESIMNRLIEEENLQDELTCESAGTSGHHEGELADARMRAHGERRSLKFETRSRPLVSKDYDKFDYILVMDDHNYRDVLETDPTGEHQSKVHKITSFCERHKDDHIPDPYYGGSEGFEHVIDLLEDACQGFLKKWKEKSI